MASDPTISRIIDDLAADVDVALARIDFHVIVDVDATLVTSHSEKEWAASTFKRGFGFHPMLAFVDHGPDQTGTPLAAVLRPGNAGSNTASDHSDVLDVALAQLAPAQRARVLVRTDCAGGTKAFVHHLTQAALAYSVGFAGFLAHLKAALDTVEEPAWVPAVNADAEPREGAWVTEITHLLDLAGPTPCAWSPARNAPTPARN